MITITRINGKEMVINAELIEFVETTPDTIISTTSGKKILVLDTVEEVIKKVIKYRCQIFPWKKSRELTEEEIRDLAAASIKE